MRRRQPESAIQRTIVKHLQVRAAPNTYWFSIPNGGARSAIEAKIMQGTGTRKGCPDMCFIGPDGKARFLELKAESRKPTGDQVAAIAEIRAAGAEAEVATGLDQALSILENWQLLRGRAGC